LSWTGYPASVASGDETAESVELVEAAEEMEERGLGLLDDIELAADGFVCSSDGIRGDSCDSRILE
jgi:hypothetical protein